MILEVKHSRAGNSLTREQFYEEVNLRSISQGGVAMILEKWLWSRYDTRWSVQCYLDAETSGELPHINT